jgi:hypothetical protein
MLEESPMDLGHKTSKRHKKNEIIGRRLDGLKIEVRKSQKTEKQKRLLAKTFKT